MKQHIFLYTTTIVIAAIICSMPILGIWSLGDNIFKSSAIVSVVAILSTLIGLYFYHGNKWWITALSILSVSFYALLLFELYSFFMIFSGAYVIWLAMSVPPIFIGSYIADSIEKERDLFNGDDTE
jgi:hypothetical protein